MRQRLAVLDLAQRIVAVVALAAGLRTAWVYLVCRSDDGGWFAYAPLTGDTFPDEPYLGHAGSDLVPALLALAFIAVWTVASIWLLGLPHSDSSQGPQVPDSN